MRCEEFAVVGKVTSGCGLVCGGVLSYPLLVPMMVVIGSWLWAFARHVGEAQALALTWGLLWSIQTKSGLTFLS